MSRRQGEKVKRVEALEVLLWIGWEEKWCRIYLEEFDRNLLELKM